jgi:hypothetical protein
MTLLLYYLLWMPVRVAWQFLTPPTKEATIGSESPAE